MTRPRDSRGRFAPRHQPSPGWTLLRIGVDQIAAEPEPLTRQVLPPRVAPTAPPDLEWAASWLYLLLCLSPVMVAVAVAYVAR